MIQRISSVSALEQAPKPTIFTFLLAIFAESKAENVALSASVVMGKL